jgi:hypothetical protein
MEKYFERDANAVFEMMSALREDNENAKKLFKENKDVIDLFPLLGEVISRLNQDDL